MPRERSGSGAAVTASSAANGSGAGKSATASCTWRAARAAESERRRSPPRALADQRDRRSAGEPRPQSGERRPRVGARGAGAVAVGAATEPPAERLAAAAVADEERGAAARDGGEERVVLVEAGGAGGVGEPDDAERGPRRFAPQLARQTEAAARDRRGLEGGRPRGREAGGEAVGQRPRQAVRIEQREVAGPRRPGGGERGGRRRRREPQPDGTGSGGRRREERSRCRRGVLAQLAPAVAGEQLDHDRRQRVEPGARRGTGQRRERPAPAGGRVEPLEPRQVRAVVGQHEQIAVGQEELRAEPAVGGGRQEQAALAGPAVAQHDSSASSWTARTRASRRASASTAAIAKPGSAR